MPQTQPRFRMLDGVRWEIIATREIHDVRGFPEGEKHLAIKLEGGSFEIAMLTDSEPPERSRLGLKFSADYSQKNAVLEISEWLSTAKEGFWSAIRRLEGRFIT